MLSAELFITWMVVAADELPAKLASTIPLVLLHVVVFQNGGIKNAGVENRPGDLPATSGFIA